MPSTRRARYYVYYSVLRFFIDTAGNGPFNLVFAQNGSQQMQSKNFACISKCAPQWQAARKMIEYRCQGIKHERKEDSSDENGIASLIRRRCSRYGLSRESCRRWWRSGRGSVARISRRLKGTSDGRNFAMFFPTPSQNGFF